MQIYDNNEQCPYWAKELLQSFTEEDLVPGINDYEVVHCTAVYMFIPKHGCLYPLDR